MDIDKPKGLQVAHGKRQTIDEYLFSIDLRETSLPFYEKEKMYFIFCFGCLGSRYCGMLE
jgi:hypothetical protein